MQFWEEVDSGPASNLFNFGSDPECDPEHIPDTSRSKVLPHGDHSASHRRASVHVCGCTGTIDAHLLLAGNDTVPCGVAEVCAVYRVPSIFIPKWVFLRLGTHYWGLRALLAGAH